MFLARNCMRKQDLATISGLSTATITKVMAGFEVTARTAGRIAKGLGVEVEDVLTEG